MSAWACLLATATRSRDIFGEVAPWLGALAGIAVIGFAIVALLRRYFRATENDQPVGFTLHDLRQMRASGELTEEQFERAKARLLQSMTGGADNEQSEVEKPPSQPPESTPDDLDSGDAPR